MLNICSQTNVYVCTLLMIDFTYESCHLYSVSNFTMFIPEHYIYVKLDRVLPERSRQGVGAGHESSNFAASHYLT